MNMDVFVISTIILAIWGAVGPLVGVRYGQELVKRWQREQWVRDNRKEEYKGVIEALSSSLAPIMQYYQPKGSRTAEELIAAGKAENNIYEVLGNRIFVAGELDKMGVFDRWSALIGTYEKDRNAETFTNGISDLVKDLRAAVLKSAE